MINRPVVSTSVAIFAAMLIFALTPTSGGGAIIGVGLGIAAVGWVVPLTIRRVRAIRTSNRPIPEAAEAIALLATLLVLGFASVYVALSQLDGQLVDVNTKIDAVYLTVTTLSTVGFGDAHASGQAARLVVTMQMLFDIAVVAVAVKLLATAASQRVAQVKGTSAPIE